MYDNGFKMFKTEVYADGTEEFLYNVGSIIHQNNIKEFKTERVNDPGIRLLCASMAS